MKDIRRLFVMIKLTRPVLISFFIFLLLLALFVGTASAETWYVDDGGGADFTKIQDVIDAAVAGDTIIVRDGMYYENVNVNKRLTIRSENGADTTIVNAFDLSDNVFNIILTDYVNISGFTVAGENAGFPYSPAGISLRYANYCNISDNTASNKTIGIILDYSSNNNLTNNKANSNGNGIYLAYSNNNTLTNNTASNNIKGIYIYLSSNNTLINNTASNNNFGIALGRSNKNHIYNSSFKDPPKTNIIRPSTYSPHQNTNPKDADLPHLRP